MLFFSYSLPLFNFYEITPKIYIVLKYKNKKMTLVYNIDTVLDLTNIDASMDAESERNVATGDVELAFAGVGNFLTGNFKQTNSDINEIRSNVSVTGNLNKARLFLMAEGPSDSMASAYGNELTAAVYETKYGAGDIFLVDKSSANINASAVVPGGSNTGSIIPLTNQSFSNDQWAHNTGSFGEGLVNAVSAALFKKVGKNAALINDTDMVASIDDAIQGVLGGAMNEVTNNYNESHYFKRYLESGRYASQNVNEGDINALINYTMNDTLIKMKINMSGSVRDTDNTVDLTNGDNVNQVFGTTNASPDPSQTGVSHLVDTNGNYNIHVFLDLRHDERF